MALGSSAAAAGSSSSSAGSSASSSTGGVTSGSKWPVLKAAVGLLRNMCTAADNLPDLVQHGMSFICLIAALIFSAGYYCARIFFLLRQTFFRFTILPLFRHFAGNLFDFSRLVSLFSHSAKSEFEHQLLSKAIQNEQSRYKKFKSEMETG